MLLMKNRISNRFLGLSYTATMNLSLTVNLDSSTFSSKTQSASKMNRGSRNSLIDMSTCSELTITWIRLSWRMTYSVRLYSNREITLWMIWSSYQPSTLTEKSDSGSWRTERPSIWRINTVSGVSIGVRRRISLRRSPRTRMLRNWSRLSNRFLRLTSSSQLFKKRYSRQVKICCV